MTQESNETLQNVQNAAFPMVDASLRCIDTAVLWLEPRHRRVHLVAPLYHPLLAAFSGETEAFREGACHLIGPLSPTNAATLQETLSNLKPGPLGLTASAGFGDRLGLATPGHARALERVLADHPGANILPIFAQQSIREMTRTKRTPQEVMTDATWDAFQAGYKGQVGADADHLKTLEDIDACAEVGYSFFTIDPGEHVASSAHTASAKDVSDKVAALPWDTLETTQDDLLKRYAGSTIKLETQSLTFDREAILRAAAKYGAAIAHVVKMYRHLDSKNIPFELEVSVDETDTPTTHVEHAFIASELQRLDVQWVSLAPRFVGSFEKGVDYIGDLEELEKDLNGHAEIARALGPYKLSLHSGSDKFSVYPLIAKATRGVVHLKTAGTSYLEALRIISTQDAELFKRILDLSHERFRTDRKSYHLSCDLAKVPTSSQIEDDELSNLLYQNDSRQVLHVTYGSALDEFGKDIHKVLDEHEEKHYEALAAHFEKHLKPFSVGLL